MNTTQRELNRINDRLQRWINRMPKCKQEIRELFAKRYELEFCQCCERLTDRWNGRNDEIDVSGECDDCIEDFAQQQDHYDSLEQWIHK